MVDVEKSAFFFWQVVERELEDEEEQEVEEQEVKKGNQRESVGLKDLEKGEMGGFQEQETVQNYPPAAGEMHMSRNQRLSATNPLRLVINSNTRVASPSINPHPSHQHHHPHPHPHRPSPSPSVPRSTPTPQVSLLNLCFQSCDWSN